MAELTALRRSPLEHLNDQLTHTRGRHVTVHELAFHSMTSIRVEPESAAYLRISEHIGAPLPVTCGQTAAGHGHTSFWLGPDEWLVVSNAPAPAHGTFDALLLGALGANPGAVVDVSANRTIVEIAGAKSREVLEKGCPADLHPTAFAPGNAVLTTLGHIPVLLWQLDAHVYRLLPRASFADYLARWLLDAASEYDGPEVP